MHRRKRNHGVITVLISLLLVGVLSIGTLCIEAGRYQAAKTQLAESNISTSTSMIAAYDAELYARYGLLAIDTEKFTPERATDYLNFNADQAIGYRGNRLSRLYAVDSVELTGLYNLTYPSVLKRQILSRAKYHVIPQEYMLNVSTMDAFFADFQSKCLFVQQRLGFAANGIYMHGGESSDLPENLLAALQALRETYKNVEKADEECNILLSGNTFSILPSATGTVGAEAPDEDITAINSALSDAVSVLGSAGAELSYGHGTAQTETDITVSVSYMQDLQSDLENVLFEEDGDPEAVRQIAKKIVDIAKEMNAAINVLKANKESNILLNSYIAEYFSNRNSTTINAYAPERGSGSLGTMDNANFISACVEYVFCGSPDEQINQKEAYSYLQAIRLINNLYAVISDADITMQSTLYNLGTLIAWANYETIIDMELLTKHSISVPFNKNKTIIALAEPGKVAEAYAEKSTVNALKKMGFYDSAKDTFVIAGEYLSSYRDLLALGLWFVPNTEKIMRVADLIQLEMRYYEQYVENKIPTFTMGDQNTYCRIKCIGKFSAVLPMLSLDSGDSARGIEFQSIKYAGY